MINTARIIYYAARNEQRTHVGRERTFRSFFRRYSFIFAAKKEEEEGGGVERKRPCPTTRHGFTSKGVEEARAGR